MTAQRSDAVLAEGRLPGKAFDEFGEVEVAGAPLGDYLTAPRPDIRAVIALGGKIDAAVLDRLPNLRVVARFGVGYDAVDVDECSRRGVQVAVTPGPVEIAVAELTMAMMLDLRLCVRQNDARVRDGGWGPPVGTLPTAQSLSGATLGLIGFGRIARQVAVRAAAFGMRICYSSRRPIQPEDVVTAGAQRLSLPDLLVTSDVVSVHLPLTPATRGMIGAAELALLRPGAVLLNTARGEIIEEQALVDAVTEGRIHVGLDVFWEEPDVPAVLRNSENVLLSPHAGSATASTREEMTRLCLENVLAALSERPAAHLVAEQRALFG